MQQASYISVEIVFFIFPNNLWSRKPKDNMLPFHYSDVIMSPMGSQDTSLSIVYSTVYSGADQRKYQSSASLAFVRWIHRRPVNSPHKRPVTRKIFPFHDVIMLVYIIIYLSIKMIYQTKLLLIIWDLDIALYELIIEIIYESQRVKERPTMKAWNKFWNDTFSSELIKNIRPIIIQKKAGAKSSSDPECPTLRICCAHAKFLSN